jgi:hypothetical protein
MADQVQQHELRAAVTTFLADREARGRYQRTQPEATSDRNGDVHRPRPLEFDERGFPIPQSSPGFVMRVARLLNPR